MQVLVCGAVLMLKRNLCRNLALDHAHEIMLLDTACSDVGLFFSVV